MKLVIVESPAKAKTIEKFLGRTYKVLASVGHIRDLPKSKMGIDIEDNFEPKYINIRGKGDIIKNLRKHAKKADAVYLATDPDREGEAIAWHLTHVLEKECSNFKRIEFNAITKETVKNAVKNPREIDLSMVDSQQARRILDRIVGYSISPILWRKIRRGLSAGRVQSVATRIICSREEEIKKFVPKEYWTIEAKFKSGKSTFKADFHGDLKGKKIELGSEAETKKVLNSLKAPYTILKVDKKAKNRKPYPALTTSSLQQEASNKFGFSTKKTMMIAQQLYEGISIKGGVVGLITYMRTDSIRISPEASKSLSEFIENEYGKKFLSKSIAKKSSKNIQDAHEAIRPSDVNNTPEEISSYLSKDQNRLYELIWKRFVASSMSDAKYESTTATISSGDYTFRANGSILKFEGFLKVYDYTNSKDNLLPELKENETVNRVSIKENQHFTLPPARYTEASLVKTLEELGIGRPSTYSPTISTILSRGYVAREKKSLYPTELGFLVDDIMKSYFNDIIDLKFSANLEEKLDSIALSEENWRSILSDFYKGFKVDLERADKDIEKVDMVELTDEICEKCGAQMAIKYGRYGKFLACSNYPECENTRAIMNKIGLKCPKCKDGDVIIRKTKKFRTFYGCSTFPKCKFINWNKPTEHRCPDCDKVLFEHQTRKLHELKCDDKECGYKRDIKS